MKNNHKKISSRFHFLKKSLSKELKKVNPNEEICKALQMEIAKINLQDII